MVLCNTFLKNERVLSVVLPIGKAELLDIAWIKKDSGDAIDFLQYMAT